MQTLNKLKIGVAAFLVSLPLYSETLVGSSTANIQQLIQLQEDQPLNFATILPGNSSDQIVITQATVDGTISSTSGNSVLSGTFTQGKFTITGVPSTTCTVTVDASTTLSGPGADMTVDNLLVNRTEPLIEASGTTQVVVGGTLNINTNQQPGLYSGTYNVTVNYM